MPHALDVGSKNVTSCDKEPVSQKSSRRLNLCAAIDNVHLSPDNLDLEYGVRSCLNLEPSSSNHQREDQGQAATLEDTRNLVRRRRINCERESSHDRLTCNSRGGGKEGGGEGGKAGGEAGGGGGGVCDAADKENESSNMAIPSTKKPPYTRIKPSVRKTDADLNQYATPHDVRKTHGSHASRSSQKRRKPFRNTAKDPVLPRPVFPDYLLTPCSQQQQQQQQQHQQQQQQQQQQQHPQHHCKQPSRIASECRDDPAPEAIYSASRAPPPSSSRSQQVNKASSRDSPRYKNLSREKKLSGGDFFDTYPVITVNKKKYQILKTIGMGGYSKVGFKSNLLGIIVHLN